MLDAIAAVVGAWLGATALFVGIPLWRAYRREPLRRHALFLPRTAGALPLPETPVWMEWWKPFAGIAGSGRGRVIAVRDGAAIIAVGEQRIEFRPRRFGAHASSGRAVVEGVEVSAVVVNAARS